MTAVRWTRQPTQLDIPDLAEAVDLLDGIRDVADDTYAAAEANGKVLEQIADTLSEMTEILRDIREHLVAKDGPGNG